MSVPLVRPATDADAPALAELLNAIIARGGTTALEQPFTPERLAATYLTGPKVISCFAAFDAETGEALGFQTLVRENHLPEGWGDIGTFAKVGGTQRGIGSALFEETLARAEELGMAGLNAEIRADNVGGLTFYGRMGFADHDVKPSVPLSDGTPVDRVYKRFPLGSASSDPDRDLFEISARLEAMRDEAQSNGRGHLIEAHEHSTRHRTELEVSAVAGCYYCCDTFSPAEIEDWVDDDDCALCPRCGIDSVIGDASGYPVKDPQFLKAMHDQWFSIC